jgi:hypothetical protein
MNFLQARLKRKPVRTPHSDNLIHLLSARLLRSATKALRTPRIPKPRATGMNNLKYLRTKPLAETGRVKEQ